MALVSRCLFPILGYSQEDASGPSEQYSYLMSKSNIIIALMDNGAVSFDPQKISMIQAGTHSFDILQQQTVQGQSSGSTARSGNVSVSVSVSGPSTTIYTGLVTIDAVMEAGKYYTFDYKKSHKGIFKSFSVPDTIVEVTDNKTIEKMKKSLVKEGENILSATAWSREHPEIFSGTYTSGKKMISFSGNTFYISVPAIINSPFVYEGAFFYTDNTITLKITSLQMGKKDKKPADMAAFLSYDLNKDILNITGLREGVGTILPSVKGKYYKGSVAETDEAMDTTNGSDSENVENNTSSVSNSPIVSEIASSSPASWNGSYKTKNKKKEITFSGNTFHLSLPALVAHYIYDGTYSFEGETIVLNITSYKFGKVHLKMDNNAVLNYKLNDDMLDIIDTKSDVPTISMLIKGQYYKTDDMPQTSQ